MGTIFATLNASKTGLCAVAGLGLFFRRMDLPACQKLERSENRAGTHKKTYLLGAVGR